MAPPGSSKKKISTAAETIGPVRCRKCGWKLHYSPKCFRCLPRRTRLTDLIPRESSIVRCPGCSSYHLPPLSWVFAATRSDCLRRLCERFLTRPLPRDIFITGSRFLSSPDPKSLIRLNLFLHGEISPGSISRRSYVVQFAVQHRICPHCSSSSSSIPNPESEAAASAAVAHKVEVRKYAPDLVSFFSLKMAIVSKLEGRDSPTQIRHVDHGLDFFFPDRTSATGFAGFVAGILPVRLRTCSDDNNSTLVTLEVCPICVDELICLPPVVSKSLGNFGPLAVCTGITNRIHLMDIINLRTASLDADQYWGAPFQSLVLLGDLEEYIVLDVMVAGREEEDEGKQAIDVMNTTAVRPALVKVARLSDAGMGDCKTHTVRTHLGGTLHPGDYARGYDLRGEDIQNHADVRIYGGLEIPEVLLVRKYLEKNRKLRMEELRDWKLKSSNANGEVDDGYEQFLRGLEQNPRAVFDISFQRGEGCQPQPEESRPFLVREEDGCGLTDTDSMME